MGSTLGFIRSIKLTDGTIIENMQVLNNSPIPTSGQLEEILRAAHRTSHQLIGLPDMDWSIDPDENEGIFHEYLY